MARDLALLVDGDQLPPDGLPALLERLESEGAVTERICVRNWRSSKDLKQWQAFAAEHGFRLIQRDPVATGKNAADIEVTVEAMDLFHRGYRAFCLVSGDMDFTPLVNRLKRGGCQVEWVRPGDIAETKRTGRGGRRPARPATKSTPPARSGRRPARTQKAEKADKPPARPPKVPVQTGPTAEQKRFTKPVRRAIAAMRKDGKHERGWVSVNRLGSVLAAEGHKREDYGFAKSRQMRQVLEDLGFKVMQIETGAYRVTMD